MNEASRSFNSKRNVIVGLVLALLNTLISFAVRVFFIRTLGIELLGVNSLFLEVISVMSLAELGFGMAIVYKLYRPIKENDYETIAKYMNLYRKTYNIIALVFLGIGLVLLPFIQFLVKDVNIDVWYLRLVFGMFVVQTASSYLLSYKSSLLLADQKNFIVSLFTFIVKAVAAGLSIGLLLLTQNWPDDKKNIVYIIYLAFQIVQALMINISIAIYVNKKYPFLKSKESLSKEQKKETFKDVRNIFIKRLSGVVTSSTDNILISTIVSTVLVGFYSNYVMIFSVVRLIKREMTTGITGSIGNLSVSESVEKNIAVLRRLTFIYFVFGLIMCSGLMALASLFITMWLGGDYVLPIEVVYLAIFVLFLEIVSEPLWQYLEVSGLFSIDKYIGILGSVVNLIVSIILGINMGIAGIFIGTLCTQVIQIVLKIILIFSKKYNASPLKYFFDWLKVVLAYGAVFVVEIFVFKLIQIDGGIIEFFVKGFAALGLGIALSIIPFLFTDQLKYAFSLITSIFAKFKRRKEST